MGKIIDIVEKLKSNKTSKPSKVLASMGTSRETSRGTTSNSRSTSASVSDITEARQEIIDSERREVKRTILTEFIGAFAVLPEQGLLRVSLYDISDNGIAFDLASDGGMFEEDEEVAMRVYLNHKTYFPFVVRVINSRLIPSENVIRHGAHFSKGTINDVALHHFVKFIETVSASLKTDDGDIQVSNIS